MPAKAAPAYVVPPLYNWTGFYVGINGGYGWGTSSFSAPFTTGSFDTSGGLVGGTLGYNWQSGQVVFGLEGDLDWTSIRGSSPCGASSCETRNDWLGTVRGRLGYAFDRFMPYVTGGAAFGNIKTSIAGFGSSSDTNIGWTLGAGIEARHRRTVDRQDRISLRRSRRRRRGRRLRSRLQHQHRARRSELSLLIGRICVNESPGAPPGLFFLISR